VFTSVAVSTAPAVNVFKPAPAIITPKFVFYVVYR